MSRRKTTENTTENLSIIDVELNGLALVDAIDDIKARLENIERSAFNIALECAYTLGITIPAHVDNAGNEHGEAVCENPIKKQSDLLKLIGRSKATLSRWIKAMNLIIDNGYFQDFASGKLPFSYDKIIVIMEHQNVFAGYILADLMTMSCDTLEAMTFFSEEEETGEEGEETSEEEETGEEGEETGEEGEETGEEGEETGVLTYNGKDYVVNKAVFEKWLAENATLA